MITGFGAEPATTGQRDFYAALGWAIAQWQDVEYAFSRVSGVITADAQTSARRATSDSTNDFKAKLDTVNAAAQVSLERKRLETWNRLYKKVGNRAAVRDELLHFSVVHTDPARSRDGYPLHLKPRLGAPVSPGEHGGDPPTYNTKQILEKGRSFARLGDELLDFAKELGAIAGP